MDRVPRDGLTGLAPASSNIRDSDRFVIERPLNPTDASPSATGVTP